MKRREQTGRDGAAMDREPAAQATADNQGEAPSETTTAPVTDELASQLDAARKEAAVNLEGWQRTLAEFQNYRRRTERETKDSYQNATADVLKALLPIIDDFERALANTPADAQGQAWLNGVQIIHRKFTRLLEDFGVSSVDPVGQPFDPNMHQAIGADDSTGLPSGTVTETLQKGYAVGDRVLRPAMVKVAP